jgi:hypothetical protein
MKPRIEGSFHTARIGREQLILLAETSMGPLRGVVLGSQTSDFGDQPVANLRGGFGGKNGARWLGAVFRVTPDQVLFFYRSDFRRLGRVSANRQAWPSASGDPGNRGRLRR